MAAVVLADNAYGTLNVAIASTDSAISLTQGHGARFPGVVSTGSGAAPLYACLINSGNVIEEIKITVHGTSSDTMTVVRGVGGTTAKAWSAGDRIEARVSSSVLNAISNRIANIMDPAWGVIGDGSTDDSVAIQAAIDVLSATGGGSLYCPPRQYKADVILKQGVYLWGNIGGFGYLPSGVNQTEFIAAGAGVVIDTPAALTLACGVIGINIQGLGAGTAVKGIRFQNVTYGFIKQVNANNLADEGLLISSSCAACVLEDILAANCVLNRVRAAKIGAIDVDGTDHFASRLEGTISGDNEGTVQSTDLYCVGIMWRATNCRKVIGLVGEFSDVGIEVSGSLNAFFGPRGDKNLGHGILVTGGSNQLFGPEGLDNSQDTNNEYDNIRFSAASGNNTTHGAIADCTLAKKAKYGINDLVASATTKNRHISPKSTNAVTAQYLNDNSNGSAFEFSGGAPITFSANTTTPDVTGATHFLTNNSNPTVITDFTGGVSGQRIFVLAGDSNTTFQSNGATILLPGGSNIAATIQQIYQFMKTGTLWRRVN